MDLMVGNFERLLDHATLRNRELEDQHPISSIIGLNDRLKELEGESAGVSTVSDRWRVVELYPIGWESDSWTDLDATSAHNEYFPMPDEINIGSGTWEIELVVLGLYGSGISSNAELLSVALMDRMVGMEDISTYCEPFSVQTTQTSSTGKNTVKFHAIVNGTRYFTERDGYVRNTMIHNQEYYGEDRNAPGNSLIVNTVAMQINAAGTVLKTGGIYLRYRQIM